MDEVSFALASAMTLCVLTIGYNGYGKFGKVIIAIIQAVFMTLNS